MSERMRAMVLDSVGPDAEMRLAQLPIPEPAAGQVRVRVEAVGVNTVDVYTREGMVALDGPRFPLVLGWDAAGTVDAAGAHVDGLAPGDRVIGFSAHRHTLVGTYAEYVVLDAGDVATQPRGTTPVEAAALPSSGLTALQALEAAAVREGDELAVVGATGVVGGMVCQIAVARGAHVTAVTSIASFELARSLGARGVVDRDADVPASLRRLSPDGATVAICAAAGASQTAIDCVREGGRFCTITEHPEPRTQRGIDSVWVGVDSHAGQLEEISRLVEDGLVAPRVARTLRLEDAQTALDLERAGGLGGKVTLTVAPRPGGRWSARTAALRRGSRTCCVSPVGETLGAC